MIKIKVFTAFSGYDSQCLALERLKDYSKDFDYDLIGWSEIDDVAIRAHDALFPEFADKNYGDISQIDWQKVPDFDLFTYSSPCQDWSASGLRRGGEEGTGTRSSLLWECRKTIEIKRPDYCIMENVTGLLTKRFLPYLEKWIEELSEFGYDSWYTTLQAQDFGIPQTRPRMFLVSIKKELHRDFSFPSPIGKCPHLYEYLDKDEDVEEWTFRKDWRREHYLELNPTHIAELESNPDKYALGGYDVVPCGVYCHASDAFNRPPFRDCARTLKALSTEAGIIYKKNGQWFMRLFTPRECFRLMGLTSEEYECVADAVGYKKIPKLAGNSICVNVLFHIFRKMFVDIEPERGTSYTLF